MNLGRNVMPRIDNMQNVIILRNKTSIVKVVPDPSVPEPCATAITTEIRTNPSISSITAAPRILIPALEFNFPISFSVSTVILTLVAVSITCF